MKKIKLVSIWNPKGGQGKSLLAINLAAAAVERGLKPMVICQDQQGTSMLYYKSGNLPFEVVGDVPKEKPDADIVFIDHQASDWKVPKTKILVMPLKPARDQFATYVDAKKRAEKHIEGGKNIEHDIITVVTDGQEHRADERVTTRALKELGSFVIPSSGVFSRAASEYHTIYDPSLDKAYKVKERRHEIAQILRRIYLKDSAKTQQMEVKEYAAG